MRRLPALAAAILCLALAACGDNGAPRAGNGFRDEPGQVTFRRGNGAEPKTLDPVLAQGNWEDNIISDMLVGLTTFDAKADPIPGAAESWTTSPDGLTWTFHLRDHKWSDGQPVTADDFVFAWRRILDPKRAAPYAYNIYVFKNARAVNSGKLPVTALGARAIDARTLELKLEHPAPYLPQLLTHMTTYPVPRHVVEKLGDDWVKAGNFVGNGPYTLVEWRPNDHVTVKKNPLFYDAANVQVTRVIYYNTDDYDSALRRFRAGELDEQDRLPAGQIEWIRKNLPNAIDLAPQNIIEFITVNQSRKPLNDVRVRRALNLALDRQTIANSIRRMNEPQAYNYVPAGVANFPGGNAYDFKNTPMAARIAEAQKLMQAAGYGPNKRLATTFLLRSTSNDTMRRVAAAIQQMWRAAYVDIAIVPLDTAIFYDRLTQHDFDLAEAGWVADFNDATSFLDMLLPDSGNNWGLYKSDRFAALMSQARTEMDTAKRGALLAQAEGVAMNDHAWLPMYFWVEQNLVQPYVKGWQSNPVDFHRTRWVTLDTAARRKQFP